MTVVVSSNFFMVNHQNKWAEAVCEIKDIEKQIYFLEKRKRLLQYVVELMENDPNWKR